MNNFFSPHIALAQGYWQRHLKPDNLAIDMTCGNGHDTLVLSRLLPQGFVIGIDIQKTALQKTEKLLVENGVADKSFQLLHQSHADPIAAPSPPRLIVYNLGYLPGADKSIVTTTESTLESLNHSINILSDDGAISITCYPGHEEGLKEEGEVLKWASELPSSAWRVCHHRWINRDRAPSLLWIEQIKRLTPNPRTSE